MSALFPRQAPPPAGERVPSDVARVLHLTTRDAAHVLPDGEWWPGVEGVDLTDWARGDKPDVGQRLRPIQSRCLVEAALSVGELAFVGVGRGKTLVDLLLPRALGAKRPLILTKASLVPQLEADREEAAARWDLGTARDCPVWSHHALSSTEGALRLDAVNPDLVVVDEAAAFSAKGSRRTRTLGKWIKAHPDTRVVFLSGTLLRRSVRDLDHLGALALRERSPLPTHYPSVQGLAEATDPARYGKVADPGPWRALLALAAGKPLPDGGTVGTLREAVQWRIAATPGCVVATEREPLPSLELHTHCWHAPELRVLDDVAAKVRKTWERPDGEPFALAVDLFRVLRQVAAGFYYVPDWSNITPDGEPDEEWVDARREWLRACARLVTAEPGHDTPPSLARLCERGELSVPEWPAWAAVRGRPTPPNKAVWISDCVIRHAVDWAVCGQPAVVWYLHTAVGDALRAAGLPTYGAGDDAARAILQEDGSRSIACSIKAHGEGRNLQSFSRALVLESPVSGWEQLLGRLHRSGQKADEVEYHVAQHAACHVRALDAATELARFVQDTTGEAQRLLYCQRVGEPVGNDLSEVTTDTLRGLT